MAVEFGSGPPWYGLTGARPRFGRSGARRLGWAVAVVALATGFLHGALSPDSAAPPVEDWFAAAFPAPLANFNAE